MATVRNLEVKADKYNVLGHSTSGSNAKMDHLIVILVSVCSCHDID